ncbi:MAG: hypothetical protein AB7U52_05475 [Candidatus Izemoplasmatales bacterium]
MKNKIFKGLVTVSFAIAAVFTVSLTSVNAQSVYEEYSTDALVEELSSYTVEEMLNYALLDEYMAKAEYEAIIETFGEIKPFTNIVLAEQTHIDLLLPLFEAYGFVLPENNAVESVVIPDSITSALATGVEAEEKNIAMYETFLAQDNLPEDVRAAFEYLVAASEHHLAAFSADRYSYVGADMMNQFKKAFKYQGSNGQGESQGQGNAYKGSNGNKGSQLNQGICPNA